MSINVNDKNLGHATAYAYYKAGGGTMTEAEFTEFMADFGTASQTAVEAAQAALASKNAAQTAATTATNKASEATTAATTATTKAGEAQTSAQTASTKASEAVGCVETATQKATESAQSASQALGYKNDAESAKTASQTAQGLAESARDSAISAKNDAESARDEAQEIVDGINAKSSQIDTNTADITELESTKADLSELYKAFPTDSAQGAIASFTDGAELPIKSLTVDIEPIQDLHGYDNPWPAGGGKNKFNGEAVATTNTVNWGVAWNDSTNTLTIEHKNAYSSGIPSVDLNLAAGTYVVSGNLSKGIDIYKDGAYMTQLISGRTFVAESGHNYSFYFSDIEINTATYSNLQLELGSTATTFEPYSNICPISGHTQAAVTRTGVNVWDEEWEVGGISADNGENVTATDRIRSKNYISVVPGVSYYFKASNTIGLRLYDGDKHYVTSTVQTNIAYTIPANIRYVRFIVLNTTTYNHDISINYPSTDHDYHPHSGQSINIQLGQTVYGGMLDVTNGVLTVDRAMADLGSLYWEKYTSQADKWRFGCTVSDIARVTTGSQVPNIVCEVYKTVSPNDTYVGVTGISNNASSSSLFICDLSISETADFRAAINGKKVVYPLATPITVQLTPQEFRSLLGSNNVWADSGNTAVEYRADPTLYIGRLTEPDADMVADANITSGSYFMVGNTLYKATANIASGATISPNVNCTRKSLSEALNELNA